MFIEKKRKRQIHLVWSAWGVEGLVATLAREETSKLRESSIGSSSLSSFHLTQEYCYMTGRTNCTHVEMLPKGEWPKWCRTCGGSGLDYCPRCLGTGEYRYVMGFQFMKRDVSHTQDRNKRRSVADFYEE
uniref:Uncharacterized protein n=2 Tax=Cannabis sativa TaxID=3483 RepID=A0A803QDE7_CANSA